MKYALVVVALAACKSPASTPSAGSSTTSAPSPAPAAPAGGASTACENVIAKLEALRNAPHGALDEVAKQCADGPWSTAYRECIIALATKDEIATCDRQALLAHGVDLGGPDCEQVMEHFATVERLPADVFAKMKTKLLLTCGALPRTVKECSLVAVDHAGLAACAAANHESAR